jgi:hypothetical protein
VHERDSEKAARKAGQTLDIRTMLESQKLRARITQEEYDLKCVNAMVACNWSFEQFRIGPFRELLDTGHGFEVPTPKIMKARLKKYTKLAQKEIKDRLGNNDSRISLALDCWSSSNRLEFMGTFPSGAWHSFVQVVEEFYSATAYYVLL